MKVVKTFTAIQISKSQVDDDIIPIFRHIRKKYYDDYVPFSFDTEEDAIAWAYNTDEYANWLIIPKISFDNF